MMTRDLFDFYLSQAARHSIWGNWNPQSLEDAKFGIVCEVLRTPPEGSFSVWEHCIAYLREKLV